MSIDCRHSPEDISHPFDQALLSREYVLFAMGLQENYPSNKVYMIMEDSPLQEEKIAIHDTNFKDGSPPEKSSMSIDPIP